ncbi:TorF family putative porin [Polynucleobacter acidiphobus]|uniref:TorF family putative porin n=1 Tax=Polynucleobacter acidiphobus TaxID=556053 RepID=UPI000D3C4032|nr:TorF family putative porin [Polynucleobacter acidiphobus]
MNTFKKTTLALAISALAGGAMAQSAPAPAPETSPITANVTLVNDYRFRGISQTNFKPAIQGGFDYAHESGVYVGNWNSNISWISDGQPGVSAPLEMNFYGGFKKELIAKGFASDIGVLQYYYPTSGAFTSIVSPNTTEIYAAQNFTLGPVAGFVKFSYAVTNAFGNANSSGSYYPDLTVNYDTGIWGITANGHIGYQYIAGTANGATVSNSTLYSYTDWKLGFTKDFGGGLSAAIAYVGTNAATYNGAYSYATPASSGLPQKNLGRAGALVSLTKTF